SLLENVSLSLSPGTFIALVGPNGAGKSTLLKVLSGEHRPAEGRVLLDGKPLDSYSKQALALRRAVMPQEVLLNFPFTSEEVVMMGRYPHRGSKGQGQDDTRIIEESMQRTETAPLRKRLYPTLSG